MVLEYSELRRNLKLLPGVPAATLVAVYLRSEYHTSKEIAPLLIEKLYTEMLWLMSVGLYKYTIICISML